MLHTLHAAVASKLPSMLCRVVNPAAGLLLKGTPYHLGCVLCLLPAATMINTLLNLLPCAAACYTLEGICLPQRIASPLLPQHPGRGHGTGCVPHK